MSDDPHIHVEVELQRVAAVRSKLAATFGLVGQLPSRVRTGCGIQVPYAMTSPRPESVTCLACREHAARWHAKAADQLGSMPGIGVGLSLGGSHLIQTADLHRELARRFLGPG